MIIGVLTTCHTQYAWYRRICIFFLFNRTTLQVFVTYLIGTLYVHHLWFYKHQHDNGVRSKLFVACQRWWFQWRFLFVPSVPGYLREEEEHKNIKKHKKIHILLSQVYCVWQVVKTQTNISNNPVFLSVAVAIFRRCLMPYLKPRKICLHLLACIFVACYVPFFAALPYPFSRLFIFHVSQLYHHL